MLRVVLESSNNEPIVVPKQYNYLLHQFLFKTLSPSMVKKYHNDGFSYHNRNYKLFTFSSIDAEYVFKNEKFHFGNRIAIYFNSYFPDLLENFALNLKVKERVLFIGNFVDVVSVEFGEFDGINEGDTFIIKTLSPVTTRETYVDELGVRKSRFFKPTDEEFVDRIRKNLWRKLHSINSPVCDEISLEELSDFDFSLEVLEMGNKPRYIVYNKPNTYRFVFESHMATMIMTGRKEFMEMAIKSGIGEANPTGFGMVMYSKL